VRACKPEREIGLSVTEGREREERLGREKERERKIKRDIALIEQ